MKKILFLLLLIPSLANAQTIQSCQQAQADSTLQTTDIANETNDIANRQAILANDNITIAQCTASTAQTPAQVNWADIDNLEINNIRYTQWQAARSGVNWPNVINLLAVGGCTTEAAVNWNNFNTCVANGVNMNQPLGNWPYGFSSFWCGNGKIAGTC
jgi:hypothetical protein